MFLLNLCRKMQQRRLASQRKQCLQCRFAARLLDGKVQLRVVLVVPGVYTPPRLHVIPRAGAGSVWVEPVDAQVDVLLRGGCRV